MVRIISKKNMKSSREESINCGYKLAESCYQEFRIEFHLHQIYPDTRHFKQQPKNKKKNEEERKENELSASEKRTSVMLDK